MRSKSETAFIFAVVFLATGAFGPYLGGDTDVSQGANASLGYINNLIWVGLYFILLIVLIFKIRTIAKSVQSDLLLLALLIYTFVSSVWSPVPLSSAVYGMALVCTSMVGYYLASRYSIKEQTTFFAAAIAVALVCSAIAAVFAPDTAYMALYGGALRGIFTHKNYLSRFCVLGMTFFFYLGKNNRGFPRMMWYSLIPFAAILLIMARSAGGLVVGCGMIGVGIAAKVLGSRTRGAVALGILSLGAGFIVAVVLSIYLSTIFKVLGRDTTLTGRLPLWLLVIAAWAKQPWLGYGYAGFWRSLYASDMDATANWGALQAHNGFLDILIELGIVGLGIFLLGFCRSFWRATKLLRDHTVEFRTIPFLVLSYLILYNIDEHTFLLRNSLTWIVYVSCVCIVSRPELQPKVELVEDSDGGGMDAEFAGNAYGFNLSASEQAPPPNGWRSHLSPPEGPRGFRGGDL